MTQEQTLFLKERFEKIIDSSHKITVLTGAGISVAAGIPDFRSDNGLWNTAENIERAVSMSGFIVNPQRFWDFWFSHWHNLHQKYQPTVAHKYLSSLEQNKDVTIISQNIDGLHQQAGSTNILDIHGSTTKPLQCIGCKQTTEWENIDFTNRKEHFICDCGDYLKPQVILFEEQLDPALWQQATKAVKNSDTLVVIGSSLIVEPVASLPKKVVHHPKKSFICINRDSNQYSKKSNLNITLDIEEFFSLLHQG